MASEQIFVALFLTLFALRFGLERFLSLLNIRHILAHRDELPELVKGNISTESHYRSIEYALARARYGHFEDVAGSLFTLVFLFSGFIPWLHAKIQSLGFGDISSGVALLASFTCLNGILQLPFAWHETFQLEARFGFNKTTSRTFWMDRAKAALVGFLVGIPFLYGLLGLVMRSGPFWWLWSTLFVVGFQLVIAVVYPWIIAPLFNKFTPLEEGELKRSLEELAHRCAFQTQGIFVMDGSQRSSHSNAYFTGIGRSRRIVLFDTLIQQLQIPELAAVLAHEIGHYKRKHILKMLALSSGMTLAGFFILSRIMNWEPLYRAFGVSAASVPVGILIFSLTAGAFTFWVGPFFNTISRKHEYEADQFAAEQTRRPDSMEAALIKLSEKNLSTLSPHPLYSAYHYSHPTLIERIAHLRSKSMSEN